MMGTDAVYEVDRIGVFTPKMQRVGELGPGEVGFFTASIKEVADTRVGDTITDERKRHRRSRSPASSRRSRWCSAASSRSMPPSSRICATPWGKLRLNDASFSYEMETSRRARLRLPLRLSRACSISRSSRSGWSASSTSISSRPPPRSSTRSSCTDGSELELHNPADLPDVGQDRARSRSPGSGHHPDARRISRLDPEALPGPARRAGRPQLCRQARHGALRPAAQRGGVRFLRPAEIGVEGLCLASTIT